MSMSVSCEDGTRFDPQPTVRLFKLEIFTFSSTIPGRGSSVGIAIGNGLDYRGSGGFNSRRELGIFLFSTASRLPLGPIQPPIRWVPGALSQGVKRLEREADHSSPSSTEVKNAWCYTSTTQHVFMAWTLQFN
jgi:hypothetical protein